MIGKRSQSLLVMNRLHCLTMQQFSQVIVSQYSKTKFCKLFSKVSPSNSVSRSRKISPKPRKGVNVNQSCSKKLNKGDIGDRHRNFEPRLSDEDDFTACIPTPHRIKWRRLSVERFKLTQGHLFQIGVGCVIDLLTGFGMDFEITLKRCIECEHAKSGLGENSAEFLVWYEGHISSCAINHVGSSCVMEQEAALNLWQRSEDSDFRYTTLLSDGDEKTYQYLNTKEVYGPEIKIKKEECINHVSKRLGASLRKAVKEWWARGVSLGGKSRGSLKEETIKKLSRYYQNAICSNKGDAALARAEEPGPDVKHVKTPLKETHLAKIMPIYQRLASNELFQRCIRCVTQNANENLHSIIWGKCLKETSATLRRVTIAVCDAVCEFNFGTNSLENLQKENGPASNKQSKMLAVWRDYRRVYQRKRKRLAVYTIARKKIALAKKRRNASFIKKEGIIYERGGF
ncbi:uncharacterized protein TNCV_126221 [Trichonephila clavipes]|nr:uncharacterized protein TNCV_126221 [Trichonephila clavipes]